jgi:hypothetical protein
VLWLFVGLGVGVGHGVGPHDKSTTWDERHVVEAASAHLIDGAVAVIVYSISANLLRRRTGGHGTARERSHGSPVAAGNKASSVIVYCPIAVRVGSIADFEIADRAGGPGACAANAGTQGTGPTVFGQADTVGVFIGVAVAVIVVSVARFSRRADCGLAFQGTLFATKCSFSTQAECAGVAGLS